MFSDWDDPIVDRLFFGGVDYSERTELSLFEAFARRSEQILDIGANTGLYSIISTQTNHRAMVHAFEPYPANFNRLTKNLELNKLSERVKTSKLAMGHENDPISFTVPASGQICDVSSVDGQFTRRYYKKWLSYVDIEVE